MISEPRVSFRGSVLECELFFHFVILRTENSITWAMCKKYLRKRRTSLSFEPRCEKTGLRGFRPGPTHQVCTTVLIVHRIVLFGPGSLLPRWRTEKQARGRCQLFIIYKCYSEFFTCIDRTCERNIDFLN